MRLFQTVAIMGVLAMAARCPAAAADPAPIRHLEYHISGHSTVTAQFESYSGTATGVAAAGYDGTMSIDVLALAKDDGGIVVRASITMNREIRPEQAVTCAIYGDGSVVCPRNAPVTGSMHVLLSHLGRGFLRSLDHRCERQVDSAQRWEGCHRLLDVYLNRVKRSGHCEDQRAHDR